MKYKENRKQKIYELKLLLSTKLNWRLNPRHKYLMCLRRGNKGFLINEKYILNFYLVYDNQTQPMFLFACYV